MTSVRLFKTGGQNDNGQVENPSYINFDGVDYNKDDFKNQFSDIDSFSSWADEVQGMGGSKIRNAVLRRVSEMGKAIVDGNMSYDGILKFTSGNKAFESNGRTKKKFFSGNYNSKDENTVNAIAGNYILNLLKRSKVAKEQEPQNQQSDYDLNSDYEKVFSPELLHTLKTGSDSYVLNEINELIGNLSSDEYKKKYSANSINDAINELKNIQGFYNTYSGSKWMDDDKARATLASISSPFYRLMYTAHNFENNQQNPNVDADGNPENQTNGEDVVSTNDDDNQNQTNDENSAYNSFVENYEKQNPNTADWILSTSKISDVSLDKDNSEKMLSIINNTINNTDGISRQKYINEFLDQIGDAYNKSTSGYSGNEAMNKFMEYLNSNYDKSIFASYLGDYVPTKNYSLLRFMLPKIQTNGRKGIVINNTVDPETGKGLVIDLNNGRLRFIYTNPNYMFKNKYISEDVYNQILKKGYENSISKNKNGGVLYMQYGGIAYNNYNSDIVYNPNANGLSSNYSLKELEIINNLIKNKDKVENLESITQKRLGQIKDENKRKNMAKEFKLNKDAKARLYLAATDLIGAAMSFVPATSLLGLGAGAASSIGNFVMDMKQDGFQWSDLGNFGANIGLDIIGALPFVGTSAKMSKLLKSARTIIPIMSTAMTLTNIPELKYGYNALQKLNTKGAKMTTQDYSDIMKSAQILLGLTGGISGAVRSRKISSKGKAYGTENKIKTIQLKDASGKKVSADIKESDLAKIGSIRGENGKKLKDDEMLAAQNKMIKQLYGDGYSLDKPIRYASGKMRFIPNKVMNTVNDKVNSFNPQFRTATDYSGMNIPKRGPWFNGGIDVVPKGANAKDRVQYIIVDNHQPKQTTVNASAQKQSSQQPVKVEGQPQPQGQPVVGKQPTGSPMTEMYFKKGGIIAKVGRFNNGGAVYKFLNGGGAIRNTKIGAGLDGSYNSYLASWGDSVGRYINSELDRLYKLKTGTEAEQASFETERQKFMDNVYNLQKSYKGMNDATGFGWGKNSLAKNDLAEQHQKQFESLADGANKNIMDYGQTIGRGGTNDKPDIFVDGYNGNRTALRTFGYTYGDNDNTFRNSEFYNDIARKASLVGMRYDSRNDLSGDGKGYYTFQTAIEKPKTSLKVDMPDMSKISIGGKGNDDTNVDTNVADLTKKDTGNPNEFAGGIFSMLPRIIDPLITQKVNNSVLRERLRNLKPTLVEYPQFNKKVVGDYFALKQGEQEAADYNSLADRIANSTSNLEYGMGARFTGASNGMKSLRAGAIQNNAAYEKSRDEAINVANNNKLMAVRGANQNMAEMNRIADLKSQMIAGNRVNNWMNNWYPFLINERRRFAMNEQNRFQNRYNDYMAGAEDYVLSKLEDELGKDWKTNPNATRMMRKYQLEYTRNAPKMPLIARRGGTITRRSNITINFGTDMDKFSREYFKSVNDQRKTWLNHYKDVSSENRKEREIAARMIMKFNEGLRYGKKNK